MNQSPHQFISQVMREKLRGLKSLGKYVTQTSVPEKSSSFALKQKMREHKISKVKTLISRFQPWRAREGRQVHKQSEGDRVGTEEDSPQLEQAAATFCQSTVAKWEDQPRVIRSSGFSR